MNFIKTMPYTLPLKTRYRWAKGDHDSRSGILIQVSLDGAEGWGEVAYGPHVTRDWRLLANELADKFAGLNLGSDDLLEQVDRLNLHNRERNGIASAWLSARAMQAGQPLAHYLAGPGETPADEVPINGLINKDAPGDVIAQGQAYADQGMTTFKIKCFADVARDLERVRALRDAFPDFRFRLDPNDAWKSIDAALRNMEAFATFGIDYVEDPLDTHSATFEDMATLHRSGPAIPLAWDNPVESRSHMERFLELDAVDVFIFKMPRSGGPDRQLDMIRCAAAAGKLAVMTGPIESAIGTMGGHHLAALLPRPIPDCGFSLSQHFARDSADLSPIVNGRRKLPETPGLGLTPDMAV